MRDDEKATTAGDGARPSGDSPKRHGDVMPAGARTPVETSEPAPSGDSPKRQGDPLKDLLDE